MIDRKQEIRRLLRMSPDDVIAAAGNHLVVCDDIDALHRRFAADIAGDIRTRNIQGLPSRLILPVGPFGQYPYLAELISKDRIGLENCWFFFMDEYCSDDGRAVGLDHPLSFQRIALDLFLSRIPAESGLDLRRVVFPTEKTIDSIDTLIEQVGGIDTCYGGIGIHGHVAFNEPQPGIAGLGSRRVRLNDYTITINAVRAAVGGNLETFPREAFTIGMRQILGSQRIRLYCRNGTPCDWANTVLRIALFGSPGDDYPVTHIRGKDYVITTDKDTLRSPANIP
ncbi:MAG: 6-phosphogluconolactonase [Candidatus Sigynarchaeota archaeon]